MEMCTYDLDHNISEYVSCMVLGSCKSLVKLYKYVCRLYSVSRDFRIIINNILLKDDYILKNLLLYIIKYDIKINIDSDYFRNIFGEWNMEKMERDNIYFAISSMKRDKQRILLNFNEDYINTPCSYLFGTYGSCIGDIYDAMGNIKDVNIAMSIIKNRKYKTYMDSFSNGVFSDELLNFSVDENFELFCYAIDKHITTLNDYIRLKYENIGLSDNQLKHLILRYPNLYNSIHTKLYIPRLNLDIKLKDFIINSKLIYNDFIMKKSKFSSVEIQRGVMLDNLIKINDDYNFNGDNNVIYNKNYVYFMLCYICDNCNLIDKIVNRLKDNMLFMSCYNDLKRYITSNRNISDPQEHYILFGNEKMLDVKNYGDFYSKKNKNDISYRNLRFKLNLKENIVVTEREDDIHNFMNLLKEHVFARNIGNIGNFWCLQNLVSVGIGITGYTSVDTKNILISNNNIKNILEKLEFGYECPSVFRINFDLFTDIKKMFSYNLAELEFKESKVINKLN